MAYNPFEGDSLELTEERIAKLNDLSVNMQESTGLAFPPDFTCHFIMGAREAVVTDLRPLANAASIELPPEPSLFEVAHEVAHLLVGPDFNHISDERIKSALLEGVSDLVGAEAAGIPRSEMQNLYYALNQKSLSDFDPQAQALISETFLTSSATDKQVWELGCDVDHVVGRDFILKVLIANSQIPTKELVASLSKFPPTRAQILDISGYKFQTAQRTVTETTPVLPTFTTTRGRLI